MTYYFLVLCNFGVLINIADVTASVQLWKFSHDCIIAATVLLTIVPHTVDLSTFLSVQIIPPLAIYHFILPLHPTTAIDNCTLQLHPLALADSVYKFEFYM